ncbi:MAG: L-threonylcarbamoyladenylate synthase [Candidatus Binatus sp.]|uniref:L-threonylcarbamoyladenylate synthase n=1 Tax=Candidatus Binatus sp. TaxID=2811406 RepID=UPI00271C581C|nr:L-threonylcarbamoyladenylate synthase [Candidatus Binatus sp.]MDO8434330.1 L-threonylcarbamoyladenylate synthase [Candidatus Binatus sp.]
MFRLEDGIAALQEGELVVYPTETFYGLGADPFSASALKLLFAAKAREPERPVGMIAADAAMAFSITREVSEPARRLADAFWPGPLTLVLPAREGFAPELIGADGIGVRVSPHPIARGLARGLGNPITATSANLSGEAPAMTLAEARSAFGAKVKVYLEGGKLTAAAPSTVVAIRRDKVKMIRIGAISEAQIAAVLAGAVMK